MINKIALGLAQSEKNYGLRKNNEIDKVIRLIGHHNIINLDTSLLYNGSENYLKDINLDNYNLSIKLPKISDRKNLDKKLKKK